MIRYGTIRKKKFLVVFESGRIATYRPTTKFIGDKEHGVKEPLAIIADKKHVIILLETGDPQHVLDEAREIYNREIVKVTYPQVASA
jgi:hypothetical protein